MRADTPTRDGIKFTLPLMAFVALPGSLVFDSLRKWPNIGKTSFPGPVMVVYLSLFRSSGTMRTTTALADIKIPCLPLMPLATLPGAIDIGGSRQRSQADESAFL